MKRTLLLSVLLATTLVAHPVKAQSVDTGDWEVATDNTWRFVVAVPPDWEVVRVDMASIRFSAVRMLAGGRGLECSVIAYSDVQSDKMTQSQLNTLLTDQGPPAPAAISVALSSSGLPTTIDETRLEWVHGSPVYVYEGHIEIRSTTKPQMRRLLQETAAAPGMFYLVNCQAKAGDLPSANALYDESLPTFKGFLESFMMLPKSTD